MAFAGTAAATTHSASDGDDTLSNGGTYFQGEQLFISNSTQNSSGNQNLDSSDTTYEVRTNDDDETLSSAGSVGDNGNILLDTSALDKGKYFIEDQDNNKIASFEIVEQDLSASFDDDSVVNSDTDTNATTLTLKSPKRPSYKVNVSADDLSWEDLQDVFGSAVTDTYKDDDIVTISGSTSEDVNAQFGSIDAGTYNFTFNVVDTEASSEASITVDKAGDKTATFVNEESTPRGDIANITINLDNTDTAYVQIGSFADSNFQSNLNVTDSDDDGQVVLNLNTFNTNNASVNYVTEGDGTKITGRNSSVLSSEPLASGNYDLAVSTTGWETQSDNNGMDVAKSPSDKTQLRISDRSTDSISTWIQPQSVDTHDDVADMTDTVTQRSTVAGSDNVVLKVDATGIYGAIDNSDLESQQNMSLTLEETGDNVEKNTEADTLSASDFTIVPDGDNGTFYAVISADELADADGADGYGDWKATFTVDENYVLNGDDEDQSVSTTFTYEEQDTSLNGGEDFQAPKGNSTVSGKTNLAPGTELSVVADSNIFYIPQDVTVNDDGTFSAKYNFDRDDVDNGTEFSVYVSSDEDNTKIGGVVNADMNDGTTTTTTTTSSTTTTTTSSTDTTTTSSTDTTTSTTSSSETTTSSTSTSTSSNDDGQPGFGVAVSVVALLAAALLALRREN
ncbi:chromosome segregation ATPase [Haladaptatus sp. R4]|nr:chromosome segregation ATPase [Haladaptatus sp. R4]